jgi:glyoxylase-like metal-dependent hydrolase (beta-lactamase superfamily II)
MNKEYRATLHYMNRAKKSGAKINPKFRQAVVEALGQLPTGVEGFQVIVGTPPDEFEENTYVVYNKETRDALIIDPGARDPRIETFIQTLGLKVKKILNTHGHRDHIGANRYYADLYQVKIAAHEVDSIFYTGKNQENKPGEFFSQEGTIRCGSLEVKILHTPGHSPGSVCFYIDGHLFSGDTLFKQAVGRVWGQTEAEKKKKMAQQISHIKSRLFALPWDTPVFPGHGPPTTIGEEALRF